MAETKDTETTMTMRIILSLSPISPPSTLITQLPPFLPRVDEGARRTRTDTLASFRGVGRSMHTRELKGTVSSEWGWGEGGQHVQ